MIALFCNAPLVNDQDFIGMANGGKSMGNDQSCTLLRQPGNGLLNQCFRLDIYR